MAGRNVPAIPSGGARRVTPANMPGVAPFYARQPGTNHANDPDPSIARRVAAANEAGKYGLEFLRKKKIIQPFTLTPNAAQPFVLGASASDTLIFIVDREFDFELHKISCVVDVPALGILNGRGDDFTMRIRDERTQEYMSNQPLHYLTCTGSGIFPLCLPETKYFKNNTTIRVEVVNRRATPINIWMELHGLAIYEKELANLTDVSNFANLSQQAKEFFLAKQKHSIDSYFYTLDGGALTLAAGLSATLQPITIRQEGDFEAFAMTAFSTVPFSFQVRRGQGGRLMQNRFVASGAAFGDGERPLLLAEPLWCDANTQLQIDFTNLSAIDQCVIFPVFIGRRWKDTASMNLTAGPDFYMSKFQNYPSA